MYQELNNEAKNYLLKELNDIFYKKYDDKNLLKRCYTELNLLYENNVLFVIEYLYRFKKTNKDISYYFNGMINNLSVLYVLGLNAVDPIKYNLSYELYFDETLDLCLNNYNASNFVEYLTKNDDFHIIKGKTNNEINEDNNYILIPYGYEDDEMLLKINHENIIETVKDYHKYSFTYLTIKISDKYILDDYDKIDLINCINTPDEIKIADIVKPKSLEDYIKVKSIAHSVKCWKNNQDSLFIRNKLNINTLITSRDDIYDYLIKHNIDKELAIDIIKFICRNNDKTSYVWKEYLKVMKNNNCEETFIDTITKLMYIHGRGQAISECLYVLSQNNYIKQ